ncbi:MAG TPA: hybrid sensor histidine kinase/response regulator [Verrucomicrobiae bacterium]|nr:hybrid sensor histidine kinase/response regulator [Verrucomicrobiae bacterium]
MSSDEQISVVNGRELAGTPPARILVVDDQPANIQVVGAVLGKLGHEIIPAVDGASALRRLPLRPPDLILLDLLMPDMDGCELCRRLRANPEWKDIPVIFLSAADDKDFVVRALESGGMDYITKPFNQAELITRVHTQLALKMTRDRLAKLAEDKDELIGILAHDLKNYLGGMQMSAQLLHARLAGPEDERARKLAENILRSSEQALAFVKEYLANATADHNVVLKPKRVNFSAAATTAVERYQETARRKQLEILSDLSGEDTNVLADPIALDQVLDNILSNALKFSPHGRRVYVTVASAGAEVECRIRDDGPGFTVADKERMFRRYGRLSARPTGGEPSTGLGLSIVHKLVHGMNGELVCESNAGEGATFIVRLPRVTSTS